MTNKKKVLAVLMIVLIMAGGIAAAKAIRAASHTVDVLPVSMLDMGYMEDPLSVDASIYDMDSQSIYPDPAQTVAEVYVTQGQSVRAGDRLMAYDITSQNIALKLKELEIESAKASLDAAKKELQNLRSGKSIALLPSDNVLFRALITTACAAPGPAASGSAKTALDAAAFHAPYNKDEPDLGTESNPRRYLVTEDALLYGSFFNSLMDQEDCYALIEVRKGDVPSGKLVSSWMIYSGELSYRDPEAAWSVTDHQPAGEDPEEEDPDGYEEGPDWTDTDPGSYAVDRAQTIRSKEVEIRSLDLNLRKARQELKAMQDQVKDGVVYAKKDGVVTVVSDKDNPPRDGSPFLKVSSGSGLSMKGYVSELMLERAKEGSPVTAMDMENGNVYEGRITRLEDYPAADGTMNAGGNPNCSYYAFLAYFEEASDIRPDSWLQVSLEGTGDAGEAVICLPKAYIRTQGQTNYVMKEENGVLVRQNIRCGRTYYGEYTQVLEGLSPEDYIAFPYGDGAKPGTRTKETDEMEGL